jgi:hypothetical protein
MKAQPPFVWAKGAVELHPVAAVDLCVTFIIHPGNLHNSSFTTGVLAYAILLPTPPPPSRGKIYLRLFLSISVYIDT